VHRADATEEKDQKLKRMKLTESECKNARPSAQPYFLSDGSSLFLFVTPGGSKLWRWKYRFGDRQKTMTFGKYPEVSLLQARALHAKARVERAAGTDPMATRKKMKQQRKNTELQQHATQMRERSFKRLAKVWFEWWLNDIGLRYPEIFNGTTDPPLSENLADQPDLRIIQRIYEFGKK
jgi:hypothetical protein